MLFTQPGGQAVKDDGDENPRAANASFAVADLRALNRFATGGLTPDLTLLLDIPVDESFRRIHARRAEIDRIERAERTFHERLRAGYLELAAAEPARFQVIASTGSLEQTGSEIWQTVAQRFQVATDSAPQAQHAS